MNKCVHELHEQESACAADGLCPICLKAKVEELTRIIKNECLDWAEDHTYLENMCLELGIPKDKVDSPDGGYSRCCIQNLADLLKEEIERLKKVEEINDAEHYTNE